MCRKIVLLISIMLLLGLVGNASAALVGRWSFDDQTANDSSGNSHNGTLTGNAAIVNDGTRGYVVSLDGAGDYVSLGTGSWTNPGNNVTVAAWIKVDAFTDAYQCVIAKGNATYRLHRNNNSNGMAAHMNYNASTYKAIYGSTSVNNGAWHHAAMTYGSGTMKLYVDGNLDGSVTLSTLYTNTANLCIGRNTDYTARDWQGWIDEVRLYNNALTQTEIRVLAGWTVTISGTVGSVDGVTMGGLPGSPVTSGGGNYTATVEYGWSGTATPSKAGYTFSPTNKTYSNVTANQSAQNYTPTLLTYTISGSVGSLDGVTMSGLPGSPVTSGGGSYTATVDYGWTGTATPSKAGYTFSPTNKTYSNVTANQTAQNYTPTLLTYTISGSVGSLDGVTMGGLPGSPVTSGGGAYTATVNYGWSGTATPSKAGYTFNPTNKTYSNVTSNQSAQNYTPTLLTYTISGSVGTLDGVTMGGLPGSPVTSGGAYTATVDYGWTGTATPSKTGYTFSPTNLTYSNVTANQTAQNYTPTLLTYVIFGTVTDVDAMYDMDDVTMNGLPGNPVTDVNGYYSAIVDYGWSGTVTPSRTGFTFEPSSWEYNNVTADYNTPDCNAIVIRYAISGYAGSLEGVEFLDLPCGVSTDANGFYTCDVDYGWTGTAIPEKEGYTFSPSERTYSNVTSAQSGQNYTPIINTYTISGYVGTLEDVVMNGLPGNPSTDDTGYYIGTVEYRWAGTVTPTLDGYVFEDAYRIYSNVTEDQEQQDYTPSLTALDINLLGWWNFDQSNATDGSGYGHNGTLTGDATIIDDPVRGKVLSLDGTGDYVNVGNGDWTNPGNHMTVAAWIKVGLFDASYQTVVAKGLYTYRLSRNGATNSMCVYMNYAGGSSYRHADGGTNVNDGQWHHVASTYDGTNMRLYVDGVQEASSTLNTLYTGTANLCIGRNTDSTGRDWQGLIDSVRFYNKALTAEEIADICTSETSGLIGWWKFDGDANDSSGKGHNGTMVGDVAIVEDGQRGQVLQVSTAADIMGNWVDCGGGINDRSWATLGNEMSVMAWVKANSFTSIWQYIVTKGNSFMVGRYYNDNKLRLKTGHYANENLIGTSTSNVADNTWHHVATVYDGAHRYLYIDGQLDTSDNCTGSLLADNYNLLIGGYTGYSDRCWDGYIDDVKLFSKALSDTEVRVEAGMLTAEKPTPADGATDVSINQILNWHAGPLADTVGGHNVYFGTSFEDVNSRDGSVFMGNQTETSYDPGILPGLTTYYWAVDTNNDDYQDSPWAGQVWSFTTVATNLIGYWMLNEGTGTTAADTSGYGHDGMITGAAWVNDNVMGQVLDFEGVDYITIPSGAFSSISNQITIALWQYGDAALQPQNSSIFEGWDGSNHRVLNSHLPYGSSVVYWDAGYAGTTWDRINKTATAGQYEGQWNHWAFTKNTSTGQMKIYLNGELWTSGTGKTKSMSGVATFKIGSCADDTGNYDGMISDFRVYNEVLSAEQIRAMVNQNVASEPSPFHMQVDVDTYPTLSWKSGPLAAVEGGHKLYLGTNADMVASRDASVYIGALDTNSYETDMLTLATTYYWAVDEVNDSVQGSPWKSDVWKFQTRNSTEGYYMDIFTDGGAGVSGYDDGEIGAINLLGYSHEHISTGSVDLTLKLMAETNDGNWQDDNGVLLYPDREPRFRLMYCNGGHSGEHYTNLGGNNSLGNRNVEDFYYHGGSYTGSCAGAWITANYRWNISGPSLGGVNLGGTYTDGVIPDGKTPWYTDGRSLPRSPLLRENYYPQFFDDLKIHAIFHNGGCEVNPAHSSYGDAEALVLFDMHWTLKAEYQFLPDWENYVKDLTIYGNDQQKFAHNKCMAWAHKHSDTTGRSAPCGSHPERRTYFSEETPLQSSLFQYASSGFGRHNVKAALASGVARQMNDNATVGHEKIGDKQYHQFTIEVPQGASQLQIVLDGNLYDMNLYAKNGDFAFKNEPGVVSATNGTGSDETLTVANPTAGTWYIGVKCNTTVTRTRTASNYNYTGNFEVLNGLAYAITATVN